MTRITKETKSGMEDWLRITLNTMFRRDAMSIDPSRTEDERAKDTHIADDERGNLRGFQDALHLLGYDYRFETEMRVSATGCEYPNVTSVRIVPISK